MYIQSRLDGTPVVDTKIRSSFPNSKYAISAFVIVCDAGGAKSPEGRK